MENAQQQKSQLWKTYKMSRLTTSKIKTTAKMLQNCSIFFKNLMGNWILWSILQILGVFCPYISKNGQKTAVLKYFFSAFLSISTHILCLLARFLVFFLYKINKKSVICPFNTVFMVLKCKIFRFLGLKTLKKVKNAP